MGAKSKSCGLDGSRTEPPNRTRWDNVIEVLKAWAISTGGRGTSNHTEGMRTTADRFGAK